MLSFAFPGADCKVWWFYCLGMGPFLCMFAGERWRLNYDDSTGFLSLSLFCSCPQIEKIMTLIGAGIDFSRDQQYATPGRVIITAFLMLLNLN